ncbi:hypothetical protein ciss_07640 [Carboxydothermus islandicus]|uniref:Xylose isomerase-like TIM barrel domain-containing protein n=1 Tax=Carboxydothermus islandicus TaxID=661089 RepID=A0A1L8D158_9THEO|nr:hypothetical protein [Carboxydothermus islandicus]GAV24831.1 hypothetical protein ciss_07640 [Carboxydothermus islandicus]
MSCLIPVDYHGLTYPFNIKPTISEVAGHFDIRKLKNNNIYYSLHTEYSYSRRKFDTQIVKNLNNICNANKNGIPMLWFSKEWALEFAEFIKILTADNNPPKIIEIHPPFSDYSNISKFIDMFKYFEYEVKSSFPDVVLLIENRSGSHYSYGTFIISKIEDLLEISNAIDRLKLNLKIALDIPQLFTAHQISKSKVEQMIDIMDNLKNIRHNIWGLHLWGKKDTLRRRREAHYGDLNTYFMGDLNIKKLFLLKLYEVLNDEICRYFVPEVNSGEKDLFSIVQDLINAGFSFIY